MKNRLDHIDGLRGIAAILVVIGHWAEWIARQGVPPEVSDGLRALTPLYIAGSVLISTVVFRAVERPAIRLGQRLIGLMSSGSTMQSVHYVVPVINRSGS